jgi:hypothetical protein
MSDIVKIISDNGIAICCVAYLIYFQSTTMKEMTKSLQEISTKLAVIWDKINE